MLDLVCSTHQLKRKFANPHSKVPYILDHDELIQRMEVSERKGQVEEELTSYIMDHSFRVPSKTLQKYRDKTEMTGLHNMPNLKNEDKVKSDEFWEETEQFLVAHITESCTIEYEAQKQIKIMATTLELSSNEMSKDFSQISDLLFSKRFSEARISHRNFTEPCSLRKTNIVSKEFADAFEDEFKSNYNLAPEESFVYRMGEHDSEQMEEEDQILISSLKKKPKLS